MLRHVPVEKLYQKGFTLIEAMVAILVFSVALLGTGKMLFTALASSSGANNRYIAGCIAQTTAENLMKAAFDNVSSHSTPITTTINNKSFSTVWTVETVNGNSSLLSYTTSTSWSDKSGSHTVSLTGLRAE